MDKVIIQKLSADQLEKRGIRSWSVWEKEVSRFDWEYDGDEECYILEGEVSVETPQGVYRFGAGDFVIFRDGLKCTWDISKPVRKHYRFP
ncbi:MAG: cupin domain-containing protein [Bacteroidales bacterium]|nr:cupin domain-containing protein [Bacteroidales bacterium]